MNKLRKVIAVIISLLMVFMLLLASFSASANSGKKEYITFEEACEKQWYDEIGKFETEKYYFYMPDEWKNDYNDYYDGKDPSTYAVGVYWWGAPASPIECDFLPSEWPGYAVTQKEKNSNNIFILNIHPDVKYLIINNLVNGGTDAFADVYFESRQSYDLEIDGYAPYSDHYGFYPDGLESMEGMIYVLDYENHLENMLGTIKVHRGEWFYYYGNGEYGYFPTKEEAGEFVYSNGEFPEARLHISASKFDINVKGTASCKANKENTTAISSDPSIATVEKSQDKTFTVKGVAQGETKIVFESYNKKTDSYETIEVPVMVTEKNTDVPDTEATEPDTSIPDVEESKPDTSVPDTEASEPDASIPDTEASEPDASIPDTEASEPDTSVPVIEESEPESEIPTENEIETETPLETNKDNEDENMNKTEENTNISGSGNDGENSIIILIAGGIMLLSLLVFVIAGKRKNNGI